MLKVRLIVIIVWQRPVLCKPCAGSCVSALVQRVLFYHFPSIGFIQWYHSHYSFYVQQALVFPLASRKRGSVLIADSRSIPTATVQLYSTDPSSFSILEFFPIFNLSRHILESGFTLLAFPYFLYFTSLTGHTIHTGLTGLSNQLCPYWTNLPYTVTVTGLHSFKLAIP